jgi:hypothetical protein
MNQHNTAMTTFDHEAALNGAPVYNGSDAIENNQSKAIMWHPYHQKWVLFERGKLLEMWNPDGTHVRKNRPPLTTERPDGV